MTRSLRTNNPAPVLDELRALAGDDHELLAEVCGLVVGYYRDEQSAALCALLEVEVDGMAPWIELGRQRRARGVHGAPRRDVDRPRQTDLGENAHEQVAVRASCAVLCPRDGDAVAVDEDEKVGQLQPRRGEHAEDRDVRQVQPAGEGLIHALDKQTAPRAEHAGGLGYPVAVQRKDVFHGVDVAESVALMHRSARASEMGAVRRVQHDDIDG